MARLVSRSRIVQFLVLSLLPACGNDQVVDGGTGPATVATVEVTAPSTSLTAIGATVQLQAVAKDLGGDVLGGRSFTWASSDVQVATASSAGLVTAVGNGSSTVSAATAGVTGSVSMTVAQAAADLTIVSGDAQEALGGTVLPDTLVVRVSDSQDASVTGVAVVWEVSQGGGVINAESATTDAGGLARATWTLGLARDNAVSVTATGLPTTTLVATGLSPCLAPGAPLPPPAGVGPTPRFSRDGNAFPGVDPQTIAVSDAAVGDFDGDGDQDIMVTTGDSVGKGQVRFFSNDGTGVFTEPGDAFFGGGTPIADHSRQFEVADFNGDGLADLFIAQHGFDWPPFPGAPNILLMQVGDGTMRDAAPTSLFPYDTDGFTHGSASGDVDCDGDIDLLEMNGGAAPNRHQLQINQGSGLFTVEPARLPDSIASGNLGFQSGEMCDLDRDGDLDLVLAGWHELRTEGALLLNDGFGTFDFAPDDYMPEHFLGSDHGAVPDVACDDVDMDGWPDIVLSEQSGSGGAPALELWINNQDGTFRDATAQQILFQDWQPGSLILRVFITDLNGDQWPDIVASGGGSCTQHLFVNQGGGTFAPVAEAIIDPDRCNTHYPIDVDGDGRVDLFSLQAFAIYRNIN